jgi:hypothetical protein
VAALVSSGGMTEELWIESWQGQEIFFILQVFRLATTYSMGNEGSFPRGKSAGVEI